MSFFVPPDYASMFIMALSYNGNCRISICGVQDAIDPNGINACMKRAMEELRAMDVGKAKKKIAELESARNTQFLVIGLSFVLFTLLAGKLVVSLVNSFM